MHINTSHMNVIRIQFTWFHKVLHFGNGYISGFSHGNRKVAGCFSKDKCCSAAMAFRKDFSVSPCLRVFSFV